MNKNPTQGNSTIVHTPGGQSAELKSQYASAFGIGKFAAASLYAGKFNSLVGTSGAKIDFGQPFSSRPRSLHGFFQYTPVAIDYLGGNQPAGTVQKEIWIFVLFILHCLKVRIKLIIQILVHF